MLLTYILNAALKIEKNIYEFCVELSKITFKMAFFNKLANAWYIFATSLSFIGRDKSLLAVPILLIFSTLAFCLLFFLALFAPKSLSIAFYANLIIFVFAMYLWSTFLGAAQSWMVHEVAQGKDAKLLSGLKRAMKNILDIFAFAFIMLLINILLGSLRKRGTLGEMAAGFMSLITGIAGKLVLPAMIVTERNFLQSVKQLGESIRTIPEIATFEVGIRPLTSLAVFVSIGISILFGLGLGLLTGIILFVILLLAIIVFSILINQIYYTLLYLALIENKKVPGLKLTR